MLSMIGAWWDAIFDAVYNFFGGIFNALFQILVQLFRFIVFGIVYKIFSAILTLIDFFENIFKRIAGIDPITLNGVQYGGEGSEGDLVYGFITNESVMSVFWSIVALSLVLLLVFTIVAFIKSEFTLDLKGSAKGPIISRSLKSVVNLIAVPAVSIIAVIGVNFLTRTVYSLFDTLGTSLSVKCFRLGAFTANRARMDEDFARYLSGGAWIESGSNPFSGGQEAVANTIDELFSKGEQSGITFKDIGWFDKFKWGQSEEDGGDGQYADWQTMIIGYPPSNEYYSFKTLRMVNYFYDIGEFQYIVCIGSAVAMAWILLTVCLVLIKRVFELTILFLLAPPMTAIAPLDGGQAEKKWRQEFAKRLLSVIGTIFAYNMYFLLLPLFETIELFGSNAITDTIGAAWSIATALPMTDFFDMFFQIICVIVGLSIVKSASALIANLLGIDDLVKTGGEAAKKAFATGVAAVGTAASLTMGGFKVAGTAFNIMRNVGKTHALRKGTSESRAAAKAQLGDAQEAADTADEKLKSLEKDRESGAYHNRAQRIELLEHMTSLNPSQKAELERLKLRQQQSDIRYDEARKKRDSANESLNLRKAGISAEEEATLRKESERIREEGEKSLEGVDKNSEFYKRKKADIDADARRVFTDEQEKRERSQLKNIIRSAYQDEESEDNSTLGKFVKDKTEKFGKVKIPGLDIELEDAPFIGKLSDIANSFSEWANVSGGDNRRRLQDMITRMLGDGSGAEAFRTLTNKNSRAKLFESVPEEKERSANIENANTLKGRKKFETDQAEKDAKAKEMAQIKRLIASEMGLQRYNALVEELQSPNITSARIKKLKTEIEQLESQGGTNSLNSKAEEFYKNIGNGNTTEGRKLQEFKEKMQFDAAMDAKREETKQKEMATRVATARGEALDTKISDASINQLAKAFADAILNPKGGFNLKGIEIDPSSLVNALANSINPLNTTMGRIADAIQKMLENKDNK